MNLGRVANGEVNVAVTTVAVEAKVVLSLAMAIQQHDSEGTLGTGGA